MACFMLIERRGEVRRAGFPRMHDAIGAVRMRYAACEGMENPLIASPLSPTFDPADA